MLHELQNGIVTLLQDKNHNVKIFSPEKYSGSLSVTLNISSTLTAYFQTVVDILTHT